MGYLDIINSELDSCKTVLEKFIENVENVDLINEASDILVESFNNEGKVISCGNGGSMCDAMHFAEELTGRYRENRKSLPAIAISDPSYISCAGNDYGYDYVFSRFVESMGNKNDVLFAITTSGSSENVLKALEKAKMKGMKTIVLTGRKGVIHSDYNEYVDLQIKVPHIGYADRIQEIHIKIIHILIKLVEEKLELV
jgi:D-sedoheptulose 7-phosphate isomerase